MGPNVISRENGTKSVNSVEEERYGACGKGRSASNGEDEMVFQESEKYIHGKILAEIQIQDILNSIAEDQKLHCLKFYSQNSFSGKRV